LIAGVAAELATLTQAHTAELASPAAAKLHPAMPLVARLIAKSF
jgi:hypothetical protein